MHCRTYRPRSRFARLTGLFEKLQRFKEFLFRRTYRARLSNQSGVTKDECRNPSNPDLAVLRLMHLEERVAAGSLLSLHGFFFGDAVRSAFEDRSPSSTQSESAIFDSKANKKDNADLLLSRPIEKQAEQTGRVSIPEAQQLSLAGPRSSEAPPKTDAPQRPPISTSGNTNHVDNRSGNGGSGPPTHISSQGLTGSPAVELPDMSQASPPPPAGFDNVSPKSPKGQDADLDENAKETSPPVAAKMAAKGQVLPQDIKIPCSFDYELENWNPYQSGGSENGHGTVTISGSDIYLYEGDSFTVGIKRDIEIPENASTLVFEYEDSFDTSATSRMKDAFEVALVDETGRSLAYTFVVPDRDAYFNLTEDQSSLMRGAYENNKTVTLPLADTQARGRTATVVFRMVNNDGDHDSFVKIVGCNQPPVIVVDLKNDTGPTDKYRSDLLTTDATTSGKVLTDDGVSKIEAKIDGGSYITIFTTNGNYPTSQDYEWLPAQVTAGDHTVTIKATDGLARTSEATIKFTVATPPVAVAGGELTILEGSTITIDGSKSSSVHGIYSFDWTIPSGAVEKSSTTTNTVSIRFPDDDPDPFPVTLTVTDIAGGTATATDKITVENVGSRAGFAPPFYAKDNGYFQFDDVAEVTILQPDREGLDDVSITINWGDGTGTTTAAFEPYPTDFEYWTAAPFNLGNGKSALMFRVGYISGDHTYPTQEGSYTATITVTDGPNELVLPTVIQVNQPSYISNIGSAKQEGDEFQFSLKSNSKFWDSSTDWAINWGDGSTSTVTVGKNLSGTAKHIYVDSPNNADSTYAITATHTDGKSSPESVPSITVNVANARPVITLASHPATITEGAKFDLTATLSDAGVNDFSVPLTATISWGDKTSDVVPVTVDAQGIHLAGSHQYADDGTYTITVTAIDKDGGDTSVDSKVVVTNTAPVVASGSWNQSLLVTSDPADPDVPIQITYLKQPLIQFTDAGFVFNPNKTVETFEAMIDWGDGSDAEEALVTVTEGQPGKATLATVYSESDHKFIFSPEAVPPPSSTVTITIEDDDGGDATASFVVNFGAAASKQSPPQDQSKPSASPEVLRRRQ